MTKRKATKPARSQKITAKAQRASSAVIRSSKPSRVRSVKADSIKSSPKGHNVEAAVVESPAMALQAPLKTMSEPESKKRVDFSSATAIARAYQAKILEMAQANMHFALELGPRLASIRSPVQFLRLIEELTKERIAMFHEYSNEMVRLSMKR